ncbi:argininosuccinate synthase [Candidatus Micrarchaeota archaeon]|nr:argininosuccinate synthase [Candidatus Micrarchaeota archaeon]
MVLEKIKQKFSKEYRDVKKCIVPYSGGLDSSIVASLLKDLGIEIITVTLDLGEGRDLKEIERKAKSLGSKKHYTVSSKDEFVRDYIYRAIKTNCLHEGYLNSEALSRPLLVKYLVETAIKENAQAVAHGGTGRGNDQIRIDNGVRALAPHLRIIAPIRDWDIQRDEEIDYALKKRFIKEAEMPQFSKDENLWGRVVRSGPIENPEKEIPEEAFRWTTPVEKTPDKPTYVELEFARGIPIAIRILDSKRKLITDEVGTSVISVLNRVAGANGIGRIDTIEDKTVGLKIRVGMEAPAASIIITAHGELEKFILTANELNFKPTVDQLWNKIVYEGGWYSPLKEELDAFVDKTQEIVSGKVMVKLFKGSFEIMGRSSKNALYDVYLSSYGKESVWDQQEARAFAKLYGLEDVIAYLIKKHSG